jgi:hypothetical protein
MKSLVIIFGLSLSAYGHHGQDFLVTIDAGRNDPWAFRSTFGGEYTEYSSGYESSVTQSIVLGLPHRLTFISILRYADDGEGSWSSFSATPMLQWSLPDLNLEGPLSSLRLAIAGGWEFPINGSHGDDHDHGSAPTMDCSGLIGIPPLFQACQMANQNAANHTHGDDRHGHDGIHRHGESHGFLRFVGELRPTPKDRIVINSITVFPENDSPKWGYAAAYRHRFTDRFALGLEATGDLDANGEHLLFLTGTSYVSPHFTLTLGAATGLTEDSPDLTLQTLLSLRF